MTIFPLAVSAQTITTQHDVEAVVPRLQAHVESSMKKWGTPGVAIGIVADDRLVYAQGFGVRTLGGTELVTDETVFQIGSTTKAFLGVTEALLVDDGLLNWNDKVIDHQSEFRLIDPWVTREFEITDLLAQRSGLPYSTLTNMMLYGYSQQDIIHALRYVKPVSSFRSEFAYQNAFHLVASNIVAKLSKTNTWESFLEERLLIPLGMSATTTGSKMMETTQNKTSGHRYDGTQTQIDPPTLFLDVAGGAGNINSTVQDLSRWLRFHINNGKVDNKQLIRSDVLATTYEPRVALSGPIASQVNFGPRDMAAYATGWIVHSLPDGRLIEHAGGTIGYTSQIGFDPDRRFGFIVLVNQSMNIGSGLAVPFGKYITDLLQGREPEDYADTLHKFLAQSIVETTKEFAVPADAIVARPVQDYTGDYFSKVMGHIYIKQNKMGDLTFELGPKAIPVTLRHWSENVFVAHIPLPSYAEEGYVDKVKVRFDSDQTGVVSRMEWLGDVDSSGQPPFVRR